MHMRRTLLSLATGFAVVTAASAHNGVDHKREKLSRRAQDELAELVEGIRPFHDFDEAKRRGWKQFGGEDEPLMGEHWYHERGPDYVHGDRIDWSRPSNLMYTDIGGRKVLTGVAYTVRLGPGEPLPAGFDGPNDKWHVHDFERAIEAALLDRPILRWLANGWLDKHYRSKGDNRGRVAMVHAWVTLPNPDGVFADYNRTLPYLKLGLPAAYAENASMAAAKGLNLATADGCRDGVDGGLWVANAGRATTRRLKEACAAAAAHVRQGLAGGGKARINGMGEHGWRMFDAAWRRELKPAQRKRIAAMSEHGIEHDGAHGHHPATAADHASHH